MSSQELHFEGHRGYTLPSHFYFVNKEFILQYHLGLESSMAQTYHLGSPRLTFNHSSYVIVFTPKEIAQTLPTAEVVPVLLVDGPINHKAANAEAVPYVKMDNPMPFAAPITVTNDVVPVSNNKITNVKASTSFSMALHNVRDEIAHGDIHKEDVAVQKIDNNSDETKLTVEIHESDNEIVLETQQV
ncbi:hypothetical protein QL285_025674 [Trifolium repens]|nr:hypothetical protein QL285_025674 [Trifolium repens]